MLRPWKIPAIFSPYNPLTSEGWLILTDLGKRSYTVYRSGLMEQPVGQRRSNEGWFDKYGLCSNCS